MMTDVFTNSLNFYNDQNMCYYDGQLDYAVFKMLFFWRDLYLT